MKVVKSSPRIMKNGTGESSSTARAWRLMPVIFCRRAKSLGSLVFTSMMLLLGVFYALADNAAVGFRALNKEDMDPVMAEHIEKVAKAALEDGLGVFLEVRADVHEESGETFYYVVFTPNAIVGPQGPQGVKGDKGDKGDTGTVPPHTHQFRDHYGLTGTLYFTSTTESN